MRSFALYLTIRAGSLVRKFGIRVLGTRLPSMVITFSWPGETHACLVFSLRSAQAVRMRGGLSPEQVWASQGVPSTARPRYDLRIRRRTRAIRHI